jgi:hypothetical protein
MSAMQALHWHGWSVVVGNVCDCAWWAISANKLPDRHAAAVTAAAAAAVTTAAVAAVA